MTFGHSGTKNNPKSSSFYNEPNSFRWPCSTAHREWSFCDRLPGNLHKFVRTQGFLCCDYFLTTKVVN